MPQINRSLIITSSGSTAENSLAGACGTCRVFCGELAFDTSMAVVAVAREGVVGVAVTVPKLQSAVIFCSAATSSETEPIVV